MAKYELFQDDQLTTFGRLISPSEWVDPSRVGRITVELSPEEAIRYEEHRREAAYWESRFERIYNEAPEAIPYKGYYVAQMSKPRPEDLTGLVNPSDE